jgi:aminoglycoside phosphotransferase (APT) family kinase protein
VLPLACSAPELIAEDDDPSEPWPFVGCRFIAGVELADAGLSQAQRVPVAAAVGSFLRTLHGYDASHLQGVLPIDPNGRGWPAGSLDYTRGVLDSLQSRRVVEVESDAKERITSLLGLAAELPPPSGQPVVVHGDLHPRHVIIGPGGAAVGVIDWIDVCLADPAVDLSLAYSAFAGPARAALLAAYGAEDGLEAERELRARALAVKLSLMLADYAADQRQRSLLSESLAGLSRAIA